MRTITGGQRSLIAGNFNIHTKVEVQNGSGSWIDVSVHMRTVDIDDSIDHQVMTAVVSFFRGSGTSSLSPTMVASTLNRDNSNAYSPLLNPARGIRVSTAAMSPGVSPSPSDYVMVFVGSIDTVDAGPETLTVSARDAFKQLQDTIIEVERSYGSPSPGTAALSVMQSIINDNVTGPPAVSYGPSGNPGWNITSYLQSASVSVMDAIRGLAQMIGWAVRGKWSGSSYNLTFFTPPAAPAVDTTFGPTEYLDVSRYSLTDEDVRNFIEVEFVDALTSTLTSVTASSPSSIAQFQRRYMRIREASTSAIDSAVEAQKMANAALAALAFPGPGVAFETMYFWPVEVGDYYGFLSNNVHVDSQVNLAVFGYTHHLEQGSGKTTLQLQGAPTTAYSDWLRKGEAPPEGQIVGTPEIITLTGVNPVYSGGVLTGWRISGVVDSETQAVIAVLTGLTLRASAPSAVTVSNPPNTEYWMNTGASKQFTIEVNLSQGGSGDIVLTPASIYNPASTPPRGGLLGQSVTQTLSRAPTTSVNVEETAPGEHNVTLSTRPLNATIKYRYAIGAVPAAGDPWVSVQNAQGFTSFTVNSTSGKVFLEYHSVSADLITEENHSLVIDQDGAPGLTIAASETTANNLSVSLTLDDDIISWRLWARRGQSPKVNGAMDDAYLKSSGNRQKSNAAFNAAGTNETWFLVARGYSWSGDFSEVSLNVNVGNAPTAGALSNLRAQVRGGTGLDVEWDNNSVVEAAAASRFTVTITEDGTVVASGRQAKTDYTGADSFTGTGGWRKTVTQSSAGQPNAVFYTFNYVVTLFDNGVQVATYSVSYSDWFIGPTQGGAPSGVPSVPSLSVAAQDVTATWGGVPPSGYGYQLEFSESTTVGFGWSTVKDSAILHPPPSPQQYVASGFTPLNYVRCRIRYWTPTGGGGTWSGFSSVVQIQGFQP